MRLFLFPLLLFGLPLLEIAGFVLVGNWLGLWPTLGLVVLSGISGVVLLRSQGLSLLREINEEGRQGRVPGQAIVSGAMIVVAAILLIIPGFVSDLVGIFLFLPAVRRLLWNLIGRHVVVRTRFTDTGYTGGRSDGGTRTIDLDEDDFERKPNASSPWSDRRLDER